MKGKPDTELVAESLAGRRDAFALLVTRYQDYAYGVAIGILSDFDLARDVVQDAFLNAYRDLRKLRDPVRFGGWLQGIVRHTAYRALRELKQVRLMAESLGGSAEPIAPAPLPDQVLEAEEQRRMVAKAIEGLNEKNRTVVSLHYVDGLSYADIASFLDVTEATVQGRLQRARATLRKELDMVKDAFQREGLPEDFSAEIKSLLDSIASKGKKNVEAMERLAEIGGPAVDPLCQALKDSRRPVRTAAAQVLCRIGDSRALRPVLSLLYNDDAWAYWNVFAKGKVMKIPGFKEELIKIVESEDKVDRHLAAQALAYAVDDEVVYDCVAKLFKEDPEARMHLLSGMRDQPAELIAPFVLKALKGRDPKANMMAIWIAMTRSIPVPIDVAFKMFSDKIPPWTHFSAARIILDHGDEGIEALNRAMQTGSVAERNTAAIMLAAEDNKDAHSVLREALNAKLNKQEWAAAIADALAGVYKEDLLSQILDGQYAPENHSTIIWSLAKSKKPQSGDLLQRLYRGENPGIKRAALRMLADQEGAAMLPELRDCLKKGKPRKVAQEAFNQMLRLGDQATSMVEEMFASEHWTERKAAVGLLKRWGKLTPEQIEQARSDPHVAVQQATNGATGTAHSGR